MTLHLGDVPSGSTLYIPFTSYNSTGASVTLTGFVSGDILIYKNGSVTQRSSTAGFTLLDTDGIDFDGVTGLHGFSIDLSDNTDAGFYAVGSFYWIVVSTVTIDSQTVTLIPATFRIVAAEAVAGKPKVDVDVFGGTAGTFASGRPEVNMTHVAGSAVSTSTAQLGVNVVNFGGSAGAFASGRPEANTTHIAGAAVSTSSAQLGVNLVNVAGSAVSTTTAQLGVNVVKIVGDTGAPDQLQKTFATTPTYFPQVDVQQMDADTGAASVLQQFAKTNGALSPTGEFDTGTVADASYLPVNVIRWLGTAAATPTVAGVPEVDITHYGGAAGTFASGRPEVNTTHAAGTAWGSGAITAASIASDAITAAKIADGAIDAATFAAGAITATAIAADAIGASGLAADAASEIGTAVWATAARTLTANTNLNDLSAAGVRTAVGLASANLDTQLSTIDDFLDTEVAAIKAKTDSLTFTVAGQVDANIQGVNDVTIQGVGTSGSPWRPV